MYIIGVVRSPKFRRVLTGQIIKYDGIFVSLKFMRSLKSGKRISEVFIGEKYRDFLIPP